MNFNKDRQLAREAELGTLLIIDTLNLQIVSKAGRSRSQSRMMMMVTKNQGVTNPR